MRVPKRELLGFLIFVALIAVPAAAFAQTGDTSIVGGLSCISDPTTCQPCNFAELIQRVIYALLGLSLPIFSLLILYAGGLYATSGVNPGYRNKAKGIFTTAGIGFILAISGWLIINTLLNILISPTYEGNRAANGGSWFAISCVGQLPNTTTVNQFIQSVLTGLQTNGSTVGTVPVPGAVPSGTLSCANCVAIDSSIPGYNRALTCSVQTNGACQIDSTLNTDMKGFYQDLKSDGQDGYISEAYPPTRVHKSADQMAGDSLDWSGCNGNNGVTSAGTQASCVASTLDAASKNNLRAQFEVTSQSTKDAILAAASKNGVQVNPNDILVQGSWITGDHFSIYKK